MRSQPAFSAAAMHAAEPSEASDLYAGRLRGRTLVLARLVWIATALAASSALLVAVPAHYGQLLLNTGPRAIAPALRELELQTLGFSNAGYAAYLLGIDLVVSICFIAVACLIVWRKSDAWPPLLFGHLLIMGGIAGAGALPALAVDLPHTRGMIESFQIYGLLAFFVIGFLFPDGRLVPRWVWLPMLVWLAVNIGALLAPGTVLDYATWPRALDISALALVLGALPVAQRFRYRQIATLEQRQQIKWVMFGISTAILINSLYALLLRTVPALREPRVVGVYFNFVAAQLCTTVVLLIPITVGFALLRYRLWDIDPLINRAVLYAALTLSAVAIYSVVVGYLSFAFQSRVNPLMSLAATVVIAVALQPLHLRLQRCVNRLLYGERDEPYRVLARLGQRLETTLQPEVALLAIVETVKDALKLPYVAIALGHGREREVVVAAGAPCEPLTTLPLPHGAETVGDLLVGPRAPGEALAAADRALLGEAARHAGAVAATLRLTADLQRANAYLTATREQLVLTREEERRRLRRDLHDGLGPALAAQSLKVGAIRRLLRRDVAAADRLLVELSEDSARTIGDIRRLVYNLRPPALDELGLVEALRQFAATIGAGDSVRVSVDAPAVLPALPAAVEVAAYRIVQEAVTNVVRHAHAQHCAIALGIEHNGDVSGLTIEVRDDGAGLPDQYRPGVGLLGMRERAAEVGGALHLGRLTPSGTRVWAVLPMDRPAAEEQPA